MNDHHVPPSGSVPVKAEKSKVEQWLDANYSDFSRRCQAKWNGNGEDVCQAALAVLAEKITKAKFSYESDGSMWTWLDQTAEKCARPVIGYPKKTLKNKQLSPTEITSLDEMREKGYVPSGNLWDADPAKREQERIWEVLADAPVKIQKATAIFLDEPGCSMAEAAKMARISAGYFSAELKKAGQKKGQRTKQLPLFSALLISSNVSIAAMILAAIRFTKVKRVAKTLQQLPLFGGVR